MNKRLERLLKPNSVVQYVALLLFCVASLLLGQYSLAAIEFAITLVLFVSFVMHRKYRRKKIDSLIAGAYSENIGAEGAQAPFPMAVIRLDDGGIVHVNDTFVTLTGYHDIFNEHNIEEFLPEFKTDWLF